MQIFVRGVDESLVIGDGVTVTVLEIQPHCVRVGIQDQNATPSYWEETLFVESGDESADVEFELALPLRG